MWALFIVLAAEAIEARLLGTLVVHWWLGSLSLVPRPRGAGSWVPMPTAGDISNMLLAFSYQHAKFIALHK